MEHAPEDVIAATLFCLLDGGVHKFEASPAALHRIFYRWRERDEGAELLRRFPFDTRDYFPFSDTIEESLDALQFAGYLERSNPKGVFFEIQSSVTALFEKLKEGFSDEEISTLELIADDVRSSVKVKSLQTG